MKTISSRMRVLTFVGAMLMAINDQLTPAQAQDSFAPAALAGSLLTLTVIGGQAPFATNGSYRIFTSAAGTNYTVLGPAGPLTAGGYHYTGSGFNFGSAAFAETGSGQLIFLQLAFSSPTNGSFTLTDDTNSQSGTFTFVRYASPKAPQLFLPAVAGGEFRVYLSGQPGFIYAVETSSNLLNWQPGQSVSVAGLTASFGDAANGTRRFFRPRIIASVFAPADLTNKTFNLTISGGKPPLPTNGICQWLADTNDLHYQILGGPGTFRSSGTYGYTPTGSDSSLLFCTDLVAGTLTEQLFFTSPQSGYFYATNASGWESGTFAMNDGPVEFLGNVRFTPDTARTGMLIFPANGSPATLSVTDAAGWVWTLYFPGDALALPQTITMTPLAAVDSSQSLLPLTNGVILAPDGLQFEDGVTLTVTPPTPLGPHAALLLAEGDGANLSFVGGTNQVGGLSATLLHFTVAAVTDPSDAQWAAFTNADLPRAQLAYAQATNDVISLMADATNLPPPPPDYIWTCDTSTDAPVQSNIDFYVQTLFTNETAAIKQLSSAAEQLMAIETDLGASATNVLKIGKTETNLVRMLLETDEVAQVNSLLARYYTTNLTVAPEEAINPDGNSEKFVALYELAANVTALDKTYGGQGKTNSITGVTNSAAIYTNWPTTFKNWSKGIRDGFVKQVHDNHRYSMETMALNVETFRNTVMNIPPDSTGKFQQKLAKAMTFQLNVDITITNNWGGSTQASLEAKGTEVFGGLDQTDFGTPTFYVDLPTLMDLGHPSTNFDCVSGSVTGLTDDQGHPCTDDLDPGQSALSSDDIRMYLSLCGGQTVSIPVAEPDISDLTWTGCDASSSTVPAFYTYDGFRQAIMDLGNGPQIYSGPLTDGMAEVANGTRELKGTFDFGYCHYDVTFKFQLLHTPQ